MEGSRDCDLLVLGDVNPDLVLSSPSLEPVFGQAETLVDDAELVIGGSGAIMACGAARLGVRTALAGVVGDDVFGEFMRRALRERGVDVTGVVVDTQVKTGLTVVLAREADRAILTHPGAIDALTAELVDHRQLTGARHLHIASWFLQTALRPRARELLVTARRAGLTTSVDPNWDPSGGWDAGLLELLDEVDILLPNAEEVQRIARVAGAEAAAQALAARGPTVVVKLGVEGALAALAGGGRVVRCGAPAEVAVRDAVGAGDSFDAGFLCGTLAGDGLERALALGCACGALSTRAAGGTAAQPSLQEARALVVL
ncbi:MAG TPA: carbohydrate kinase family protein [Solirubrobacteraceae bacterium]|nr:carbohydrate kinase family protein [Solirubrobacteraceae bacterium]